MGVRPDGGRIHGQRDAWDDGEFPPARAEPEGPAGAVRRLAAAAGDHPHVLHGSAFPNRQKPQRSNQTGEMMEPNRRRWPGVVLALVTILVFARVCGFDFSWWDDWQT